MVNNEKLKPCPFCSGEGKLLTNLSTISPYSLILCTKCGVSTKNYSMNPEYFEISAEEAAERSKQKAIAAWNKRIKEEIGE
jgi:Lar family restriction alleviation protein